jgi:hypothetical protein
MTSSLKESETKSGRLRGEPFRARRHPVLTQITHQSESSTRPFKPALLGAQRHSLSRENTVIDATTGQWTTSDGTQANKEPKPPISLENTEERATGIEPA